MIGHRDEIILAINPIKKGIRIIIAFLTRFDFNTLKKSSSFFLQDENPPIKKRTIPLIKDNSKPSEFVRGSEIRKRFIATRKRIKQRK